MFYATLEKQIRALPEECLDEVSNYIEFVLFKRQMHLEKSQKQDSRSYFGILKNLPDGMDIQRSIRDEWK